MTIVYQGDFRLHRVPMGPYDNNGYVIADADGHECYLVDAPPEGEKLIAEAHEMIVKGVLITHNHFDHLMSLDQIREATSAPVIVHSADQKAVLPPADLIVEDGALFELGQVTIRAIHTPGHTPGAMCYLVGKHLISGDTLFPGGPGKTASPESFHRVVTSIADKLLVLDDDVWVHPGHGEPTTIGEARRGYQEFVSNIHPKDLCGDVLWSTS